MRRQCSPWPPPPKATRARGAGAGAAPQEKTQRREPRGTPRQHPPTNRGWPERPGGSKPPKLGRAAKRTQSRAKGPRSTAKEFGKGSKRAALCLSREACIFGLAGQRSTCHLRPRPGQLQIASFVTPYKGLVSSASPLLGTVLGFNSRQGLRSQIIWVIVALCCSGCFCTCMTNGPEAWQEVCCDLVTERSAAAFSPRPKRRS